MRGPVRSLSSRIGEDSARASATQAEKEDINSRSIYIGNVAYVCNAEDVRQHFEGCGTVNWVTIVTDTHCQPKGFAFLEFVEAEAVGNALLLDGSELRGRKLKVAAKRRPPPPPPPHDGYGRVPRIQRPIVRYGPY